MRKVKTHAIAWLLIICLTILTSLAYNSTTVKADTNEYINLLKESGNIIAHTPITYNFTLDFNTDMYLYLYESTPTNCTININTSSCSNYKSYSISSTDFVYYDKDNQYYFSVLCKDYPPGDYIVTIVSDVPTEYVLGINITTLKATLSTSNLSVTVGYTNQLYINNTSSTVLWESSNKKIATVNQDGIVTGKKIGKAIITATTDTGQTLSCNVTVKANVYSERKYSCDDLSSNRCVLQVYKSYYTAKGELVMKARFINNSGHKVIALKNINITFVNDKQKEIANYKQAYRKLVLENQSVKNFTIIIKKTNIKMKTANLRNASYSAKGKFTYYN